jgi:hypothetical protein
VVAGNVEGRVSLPLPAMDRGLFLAKFAAADGAVRWARAFPQGPGAPSYVTDVAAGPDGALVMSGRLGGTVDFGGAAPDSWHNFVARYSAGGHLQWARTVGSTGYGNIFVSAVTADAAGNVTAGGSYDGMLEGGSATTQGSAAPYLVQWSATGERTWVQDFGGTGGAVHDVGTSALGTVVAAGLFGGTLRFGNDVLQADAEHQAGFLAVSERNGDMRFARPLGRLAPHALYVLPEGRVYLAGITHERPGVDGPQDVPAATSFAAAWALDGTFLGAETFGSVWSPPWHVGFHPRAGLVVGGSFYSPTDLGTGPLTPHDEDAYLRVRAP